MQLSLGELALLVFPLLVSRDDLAVEDLPVHGGEDDVGDEGNQPDSEERIGEEHGLEEHSPNTARRTTEELYWSSGGDQTSKRVLGADVLCPARLLLAHAKEYDEPGDRSAAEEREVDFLQVVDRDWDTGSPVSVESPSLRTACFASAVEDVELLRWVGLGHSADEADVWSQVVAKIAAGKAPDAPVIVRVGIVGSCSERAGRVANICEDKSSLVSSVTGQTRRRRVHACSARGLALLTDASHVREASRARLYAPVIHEDWQVAARDAGGTMVFVAVTVEARGFATAAGLLHSSTCGAEFRGLEVAFEASRQACGLAHELVRVIVAAKVAPISVADQAVLVACLARCVALDTDIVGVSISRVARITRLFALSDLVAVLLRLVAHQEGWTLRVVLPAALAQFRVGCCACRAWMGAFEMWD